MSKNANSFKAAFFHSLAFELPIEMIKTKHGCYEETFPQHTLRCLQKSKNKSILSNTLVLTCMATKLPNTKLPQMVFLSITQLYYKRHLCFALDEACDAFTATMLVFGYIQNLQVYIPTVHQVHPPLQHPLF